MATPLVDAEPPVRVAVLSSKGGARLQYLLEEDPGYGAVYEIVGGIVNLTDSDVPELLGRHDVPVETDDIHEFYDERGADLSDVDVRRAFDARIAETLAGYDPDLVVCSGYLHVLTEPVLERFHPNIVNVHHADLTVRDESGTPRYTGLDAVEDAIRAGEPSTRETTHVVTEAVDRGPLLVRSPAFPVHRELVDDALARGDETVLDAYVYAHRTWMIREAGGPTLATTIELLADGRVSLSDGETLVDGRRGVYQVGEGVVPAAPTDAIARESTNSERDDATPDTPES